MRLRYFLRDTQVLGFLNNDHECEKRLTEWILENCRICLEGCISEGYKDVAQKVLIAIWNYRDNPKLQARPGSCATTINRRKIIDALRKVEGAKETLAPKENLIDNQVSSDSTPLENMLEEEEIRNQREQLKKFLHTHLMSDNSSMSDALKDGKIALIYQLRDKTSIIAEIADIMDVPEENVRNWVSRFTQKYQEMEQGVPKGTIKCQVSRYRVHLRDELNKQDRDSSKLKSIGF